MKPIIIIGELLPWKGLWWRVSDLDDRGQVQLTPGKETGGQTKRDIATRKWVKNHSKAKEPRKRRAK